MARYHKPTTNARALGPGGFAVAYAIRERAGLVLAEHSMDETTAAAAIKELNPRFVLHKEHRPGVEGGWVYKVVHAWSDDHEGRVVFVWMDETGRPLPLSSGIVEEVKRHLVGARNSGLGLEDDHNRRLAEQREQRMRDESRAVADWYRPHLDRGRVTVSFADTAKKPLWARKPKGRPPSLT